MPQSRWHPRLESRHFRGNCSGWDVLSGNCSGSSKRGTDWSSSLVKKAGAKTLLSQRAAGTSK